MPDGEAATFTSSDKTLDAVWSLCTHSCLYVSHEQFVDSPTRQKGQFTCDATNESQAIMRGLGRHEPVAGRGCGTSPAPRRGSGPTGQVSELYPSGTVKSTIPDFTELYVEWVYRYYQRPGTTPPWPASTRWCRTSRGYVWRYVDPATGLVTQLPGGGTTYAYGIVDWPPEMRYGYDMSTVARTTVNILGANVFNRAAVMAQILGDAASAPALPPAAARPSRAALNGRLVNADGVYIDGLLATGAQSTHASQQANALALAYGLVPTGRVATVGAHVASLGIALGCDHGLELVRALHAAGLDADLVRIVTDPNGPGWGHILATGGTFCWESWTPSDLEQDSLSHGWGSGALVGLHEALLGATVDSAPGRRSPQRAAGSPSSRSGRPREVLRTPRGPCPRWPARWPCAGPRARRANALRLALSLPANAQAQVTLPARGEAAVTESGRPLTRSPGVSVTGSSSGQVHLTVGAGTYRFAVSA